MKFYISLILLSSVAFGYCAPNMFPTAASVKWWEGCKCVKEGDQITSEERKTHFCMVNDEIRTNKTGSVKTKAPEEGGETRLCTPFTKNPKGTEGAKAILRPCKCGEADGDYPNMLTDANLYCKRKKIRDDGTEVMLRICDMNAINDDDMICKGGRRKQ